MKNLETFAILLALLLPCCVSVNSEAQVKSRPRPPGVIDDVFDIDDYVYVKKINNVSLHVEKSFSAADREEIIRQAEWQTAVHQKDFKAYVETISVYVANKEVISCGDRPGIFVGCFYAPRGKLRGKIRVVFKQNKLYALYHEYTHWMHPKTFDLEHTDPLWTTTWTPRQRELTGD